MGKVETGGLNKLDAGGQKVLGITKASRKRPDQHWNLHICLREEECAPQHLGRVMGISGRKTDRGTFLPRQSPACLPRATSSRLGSAYNRVSNHLKRGEMTTCNFIQVACYSVMDIASCITDFLKSFCLHQKCCYQ